MQVNELDKKMWMLIGILMALLLVMTSCDSAIPSAPFGLTLTSNRLGEVSLNWGNYGEGVDKFYIERSADNFTSIQTTFIVSANTRDYSDNTVLPAMYYYYRVVSANGTVHSLPSNVLKVFTVPAPNPAVPTRAMSSALIGTLAGVVVIVLAVAVAFWRRRRTNA